jgi:hypothetical protein
MKVQWQVNGYLTAWRLPYRSMTYGQARPYQGGGYHFSFWQKYSPV